MNILTPDGYKNIEDVIIGDLVVAYDMNTGVRIRNVVLDKVKFYPGMDDGFDSNHGPFTFYLVNGLYKFFKNQSVWINDGQVVHAKYLVEGDILYDGLDTPFPITSIEEINTETEWWKLTISGDHTYIADGITLHNASRFWVGGGASSSWTVTGPTNWAATSGGAGNQTVPTSTDDVTFDGAGASGNTNGNLSSTLTILSLTYTAGYTATSTLNAVLTVAGNITDNTAHTWSGSSNLAISASSTVNSGGKTFPNGLTLSNTITITLSTNNWVISGTIAPGGATTINKTASETISVGGYNASNTCGGTAKIIMTGGTWTSNASTLSNNVDLQGNITIGANCYYGTNTLKYVSGTITYSNNFNIRSSCTLDLAGTTVGGIDLPTGPLTVTLASLLTVSGSMTIFTGVNCTFAGTFGFSVGTLSVTSSGNTVNTQTFANGVTYTITSSLSVFSGRASAVPVFTSDHASIKAIITVSPGASTKCMLSFTRIDASGGRPIKTWKGTVTTCFNVISYTDLTQLAAVQGGIINSGSNI